MTYTTPGPDSGPQRPGSSVSGASTADRSGAVTSADHRERLSQQRRQFGGMKFGATFFGWLTALGMAVLLTALITAIGVGVGQETGTTPSTTGAQPAALVTAATIVLLVIVFVAYFSGGYVAGRMARFNGLRQGFGVWLWAIIATAVLTAIGAAAGSRFGSMTSLNSVPQIPVNRGDVTTGVIIVAAVVAGVSLLGALLGGLAGMRFHRRVDRADPASFDE